MKRLLISLLVILPLILKANSNNELTQTVRGTVTDMVTGLPLTGAYILVSGSEPKIGAVTDINGHFELLKVPLGRQSLEISYIGYESKTVSNILVESGKELILDIRLEEKMLDIGEVVVRATRNKAEALNEMAVISARTFSIEETERFAGSLGDPARMVANYAGVMTQNDSRNDIIIRGNSPSGVLWRMEGVEIQNPNHFGAQGTTGGPVSMVNNNLLTNSDFITGAFPAEFGNATAGAFDLNLRSGNSFNHEFTGQVGFNGFEVGAEGPVFKLKNGQNATYLINYRYSTLELLSEIGFNVGTGSAIPRYQDLTFMADIPGKKTGRFKLFGLWGKSFIDLGRDLSDTIGNSFNTRGTATDFGARLGLIGLTHLINLKGNIRIKSTLSFHESHSLAALDSVRNESFIPFLRGDQGEKKMSFTTQFRKKISPADNFSAGLIIDRYDISYIDSMVLRDYDRFMTTTDVNGSLMLYRSYLQWQHKAGGFFTGNGGLLLQYSGFNKELAVEPRLGLNFSFSPENSLNLGFGLHSQMQPKVVYFHQEWDPVTEKYLRTNEDLGFSKSMHFVAGYQYQTKNNFRIRLETYYQHLYRIPVKKSFPEFSLINSGDQFGIPREDSLINTGKGKNFGVELTIEKFLSKGWYFLFTSSIFDSKYSGYDKVVRNTAFNGNYVFNLLGGYEHKLGKNSMFTIDLKSVLAGGKRYIPVDVERSVAMKEEIRDYSRSYDDKYNDYFRTDLRIGVRINKKKFSQEWAIDLQNLTGYKSIFYQAWDPRASEVYSVYQQGFVPMFLYRVKF